jgi:hypothetical protein
LLAFACLDIAVGAVFFTDVSEGAANAVERYFLYGKSIEAKVRARIGANDEAAESIMRAGWLDGQVARKPSVAEGEGPLIAIYGMSFSAMIGRELQRLDPSITIRDIGGPGAPLNHVFQAYLDDRKNHSADVVILAILASSLPRMNSTTHMTANFESPGAHFYPRYYIEDGVLAHVEPPVKTLQELRMALDSRELRDRLVNFMRDHDAFFDGIVFSEGIADRSVAARLLRRAWGQRRLQKTFARYHDEDGFTNESDMITITNQMVVEFANTARADDRFPLVLIINDRGYGTHLYDILETTLRDEGIPYFSTHEVVDNRDLSNFVPDGHFTRENNVAFARALQRLLPD